MKTYNSEERLKQLFEEFKKTDKEFEEFRNHFINRVLPVIELFYPAVKPTAELKDAIGDYATETLSSTYSVIDKDVNYNEFRKEQELLSMQSAIQRMEMPLKDIEFTEAIRSEAKKMIIDFYPAVYDLSSFGFKLLELNTKMYNVFFIVSLLNEEKKQEFSEEVRKYNQV